VSIQAGNIIWQIGANLDPLKKDLQSALGLVEKSGSGIGNVARGMGIAFTAVGGTITGALTGIVTKFASYADTIDEASERTGMSTEAMSEFKFAIEQSGGSLESFESGIKRMSRVLLDAKSGSKEAEDTIKMLGLSLEDFANKSPEEAFMIFAEAIGKVPSELERSALAQEVFGRSGTQMLPLLNLGVQGIEELRQKARDLGLVLSGEAAAAGGQLNDALDAMKGSVLGLAAPIAEALVPTVQSFVDSMQGTINGMIAWMREHPALTAEIVKLVAVAGALMAILGPILIVLPGLATLFTGLTTIIPAVVGGLGGLVGLIGGLGGALVAALPIIAAIGVALILLAPLIAGVAKEYRGWREAVEQQKQSEQRLWEQTNKRIAQLQAEGVAIDLKKMEAMDATERILYLNEQEKNSQDGVLRKYLETYGSKEAAQKAFGVAKNLMLNEEISAEEAAQVALMGVNQATLNQLMTANETQTQALLEQLGVRTQAATETAQIETAATEETAQAQAEAVSNFSATTGQLENLTAQFTSSTESRTTAVGDAMQGMAERNVQSVELMATSGDELMAQFESSVGQHMSVAGDSLDYFNSAAQRLPEGIRNAMQTTVNIIAAAVDQIIAQVNRALEALAALNANQRRSPSLNDRIRSGLNTMAEIFSSGMDEIAGATAPAGFAPRNMPGSASLPVGARVLGAATSGGGGGAAVSRGASVTIDLRGTVIQKDADANALLAKLSALMTSRFSAAGVQYG